MDKYKKLREEALKNAIAQGYFAKYVYTQLGNIDFVIAKHNTEKGQSSLFDAFENTTLKSNLWAEAKQGDAHDIYESFVQLILTIGKEKTFEKHLPPKYIGAFDAEKFAFIEYHRIQGIFYQNDFNWNVPPSNHETKEFKLLYALCKSILEDNSIIFSYEESEKEFRDFINLNFKSGKEITEKISVTKNNFTFVFQRWSEKVKPTIAVDWQEANKENIISADFFLADLLSEDNESIKENLAVVLKQKEYYYNRERKTIGGFLFSTVGFNDKQKAYKEFWNVYSRPPRKEYWDYIIARRDLLVPQDIRERKGSYFTPQIWVEKSQSYLSCVLGETWQEEYYIWDCSAGTGNLLNGLTNYNNVWASTIDRQDVDVMQDRIDNGWKMAENHVFQFDFLNDDFSKCPESLQEILNDEEKRKKLVIYINPPYAEATSSKTISAKESKHKSGVSSSQIKEKYQDILKQGAKELYVLFLFRCYKELPNCIIANFSTLKILQGVHYKEFRSAFLAKLESLFIVPAWTFDNVNGKFPIGFFIWNTGVKEKFSSIKIDIFDKNAEFLGNKKIVNPPEKTIKDWLRKYRDEENPIGWLARGSSDFQNNDRVFITSKPSTSILNASNASIITSKNLIENCIFHTVRKVIVHTWINNQDQYLYPNDSWEEDNEFKSNCLIYSLFAESNRIESEHGTNHWIPFEREQVGCKKTFKSNFMSNFLKNIELSQISQAVYNSALELWKYYHSQKNANADASLYDIRLYFQGEKAGKMNPSSDDEIYNALIADLRGKLKLLAKQIEPKVYEYGFLV